MDISETKVSVVVTSGVELEGWSWVSSSHEHSSDVSILFWAMEHQ